MHQHNIARVHSPHHPIDNGGRRRSAPIARIRAPQNRGVSMTLGVGIHPIVQNATRRPIKASHLAGFGLDDGGGLVNFTGRRRRSMAMVTMGPGVIREHVTFPGHALPDRREGLEHATNHKERGLHVFLFQNVQHLIGVTGGWPIVKGQRHHLLTAGQALIPHQFAHKSLGQIPQSHQNFLLLAGHLLAKVTNASIERFTQGKGRSRLRGHGGIVQGGFQRSIVGRPGVAASQHRRTGHQRQQPPSPRKPRSLIEVLPHLTGTIATGGLGSRRARSFRKQPSHRGNRKSRKGRNSG